MPEEEPEEEFHLEPDEVEEIVNWAINTATTLTLMHHHPGHDNAEEGLERLSGYIEAIAMLYDGMPASIIEVSHDVASDIIEEAEANEDIVQEFKKELDNL